MGAILASVGQDALCLSDQPRLCQDGLVGGPLLQVCHASGDLIVSEQPRRIDVSAITRGLEPSARVRSALRGAFGDELGEDLPASVR